MNGRQIFLVYQAGIANVFETQYANPTVRLRGTTRRLFQHAFSPCEWYAQGLRDAGCALLVASCNQAGDIATADWSLGLDDCPFREKAQPPKELHAA